MNTDNGRHARRFAAALMILAGVGATGATTTSDGGTDTDATVHGPSAAGAQEDAGRAIFTGKGNCFTCHGPDAKGTVLAPDLTDGAWLQFETRPTAAQVRKLVTEGVSKPKKHPAPMLPMGGARLSAEELDQVAAYVLGLSAEG